MSSILDDADFQRAFIATGFLAGIPLDQLQVFTAPVPATLALLGELGSLDRTIRAHAVARELEQVGRRLEERRLA